jgi:hypothetical protein
VLPHTFDVPPSRNHAAIRIDITSAIGFELVRPPSSIRLGKSAVKWAAVPETSIDEYSDLAAWEYDVGATSDTRYNWYVHAKSKPARMEISTQSHFRVRISLTCRSHSRQRCR